MPEVIALIDGDGLLHRCASAVERDLYLVQTSQGFAEFNYAKEADEFIKGHGGVRWRRKDLGSEDAAIAALDETLERLLNQLACEWKIYIGGTGPTFRDSIARIRKYKGIRREKPEHFPVLRTRIIEKFGATEAEFEEADDVISYTSRHLRSTGRSPILVSNDKDFKQIPGSHFDWTTGVWSQRSDKEADHYLWVQTLSGDPVDNIGGCYRVGEGKAAHAVDLAIEEVGEDFAQIWACIVEAYKYSQDLPGCPYYHLDAEEVANENYNLVRLKQDKDEWPDPITMKKRTVTLAHNAQA